jgi:hypothetical protein
VDYDEPKVLEFCNNATETKAEFFKKLNGMDGLKAWQVIEWSVSLSDYWDTLSPYGADQNFDFLRNSPVEEPVATWWRDHNVFMVEILDANQIDMDYSDWKWGYQVQVDGKNFDDVLWWCDAVQSIAKA